eukprot:1767607-Lingulodinium_polyedra.AAC.1
MVRKHDCVTLANRLHAASQMTVWHAPLQCAPRASLMSYTRLVDALHARCQHAYAPHVPEALLNAS